MTMVYYSFGNEIRNAKYIISQCIWVQIWKLEGKINIKIKLSIFLTFIIHNELIEKIN